MTAHEERQAWRVARKLVALIRRTRTHKGWMQANVWTVDQAIGVLRTANKRG